MFKWHTMVYLRLGTTSCCYKVYYNSMKQYPAIPTLP